MEKYCKNCDNYKITRNGREICRLRPNANIISVLCCKDWIQAHTRAIMRTRAKNVKKYSIKHFTLT